MRTDLDHLPQVQQDELARVVQILMEEFENATGRATQPWRRNGKIYKIILFGSYARNDWVDDPENGYQSDFDLLVVVSHRDLTEVADYWYVAEDRILRDKAIVRPVNIIVHSIDEVNQALKRGEYFWVDIAHDGIALYELPGHELATPMPLTPADASRMASDYFDKWFVKHRSLSTLCRRRNGQGLDEGSGIPASSSDRTSLHLLLVGANTVFPAVAQHQVSTVACRG